MQLTPGTKIGACEIIAPLGAGGMGEVFRARDTRLSRDVAIKALPEAFARDPERLARFEREAKLLASLSHPNIAGIFGIEEAADARYLVLEFVDGETLAARLARGPLAVDDTLHVGAQVAAAVEAAHEAGIIHRDLKPGNVMIRPDGTVKVLDFGLAKSDAAGESSSDMNLSASPTLVYAGTSAGVILGTAAYMSPEQARGKHMDRRTDIWSFGCLLYECLTGRQLFAGETVSDIIAHILKTEPDWNAFPAATPTRVRALLQRCLTKDPKQRLRDIGEARIVLESPADVPPAAAEAAAPVRRGIPVGVMVAIVCAVALVAAAAAWMLKPSRVTESLRTLDLVADRIDSDWRSAPQLSPDGSRIAYSSREKIWVRDLDRLEARAVADVEGTTSTFWSPDGTQLGYGTLQKLWRVPAAGGTPIAISDIPGTAEILGGAWGEDGNIVIAVWRGGLYRISATSGATTSLLETDPETQVDFHFPSLLPGGKVMFVTHWQQNRDAVGNARPSLHVLDGANVRAVENSEYMEDGWPAYVDGKILFLRQEPSPGIFAVDFDPVTLRVSGEPALVAAGAASISTSDDGSLLYVESAERNGQFELGWIDRTGKWLETAGPPGEGMRSAALSPDGRRVAYVSRTREERDIWIRDLARNTDTRLTFEPGQHDSPRWVDDDHILYGTFLYGARSGSVRKSVVSVRNADGSGSPRVVSDESGTGMGGAFIEPTRDPNQFLQIIDAAGHSGLRLLQIQASGMAEPRPVLHEQPEPNYLDMRLSPDGRLLAYVVDYGGYPEVFLTRFPTGDGKWQVSNRGGREPQWDPMTGTLYFVAGSGPSERSFVAVDVNPDEPVPVGARQTLVKRDAIASTYLDHGYQVEAGGSRFLVVRPAGGASLSIARMVLVQNWRAGFSATSRR
jgi:serine/threonine protein kinase/Tol biopolymer transport system component